MDNTIESIIGNSSSVLILLPTKPFFDQVAAGLALYLSLKDTKDVAISSPSPMTVEFNRLVGVNKIKSEVGSKNLVIKFSDYDGKQIERVSADIEDGLFQLTVIPKADAKAPQKDQIEMSYSGIASSTIILIGGINESHFPILATNQLAQAHVLHIGVRPMMLKDGRSFPGLVNDVSGVSELVASLVTQQPGQNMQRLFDLNQDVATNLLMGIEAATDTFLSPTTTADTFFYVSELMRAGGKRNPKILSPDNFPPGAIPGSDINKVINNYPQAPNVDGSRTMSSDAHQEDMSIKTNITKTPKDWLNKPKIYKGGTST
ncbi:hypothetical protein IPM62_00035 [Candidatus Woesebacteria bacterium]|nr:MAG: hypothetical protein IPM62_00035 [Candidatus Woesebacteria bacterium]